MLTIGIKTPAFTLPNTIKEQVSSEQFIGKNLVLFFFPMAWTNTCTKEMCTIQEERNIYADLNTAVVGISVDTLFALKRFGEDYKIEFPLLSDFNKMVIHDFHVVHHDFNWGYKDVAKRATFLIDIEGTLRYQEVLPKLGDFPNMDALKDAIRSLS